MIVFLPYQSKSHHYLDILLESPFAQKSVEMFFGVYRFIGVKQISSKIVHVGFQDNFTNKTSHDTHKQILDRIKESLK